MALHQLPPIATTILSAEERAARRIQVVEAIGNTPMFELRAISREVAPVRICAKAEWYNPGGSVKDRAALNMILDGEQRGALTKDKILIDATSGNTGIAYAMICAALGYRTRLCVPKNIGSMRQRILVAYGAELVLTDPTKSTDGAIQEAIRLYEESPDTYFYPDQYSNDANWLAHYHTTGPEILRQTGGEVTHFVAGLGTTGTFRGTGTRLKEERNMIKLISFQPDSPMNGLEGLKHLPTAIVPKIYRDDLADENFWVKTEEAQAMVKRLAREEGLLVGPSAGAAVACALLVARDLRDGCVVTILPDNAFKYLDFRFWDE
ncbi:MAG: cysteine synthase family protein [Candidatus Hydrogenedentota bacterium]